MKRFSIFISILLLCSLVIIGCATTQSTTPKTSAPPATSVAPPAPTSQAPPAPTSQAPPPTQVKPAATTAPATTAAPAPTDAAKYGGNLVILTSSLPIQGTPWEGGFLWARVGRAVFEPLVTCDENENILPWLAESWDIASDGKSLTFHLRKGIKFQDGTDFNADAVKFNLDSWKPGTAGGLVLEFVTSTEVVDQYTVKLNLKQWDSLLLLQLATNDIVMCSPTAAKKPTTPDKQAFDHMVGTGPFVLTEYKKDISAKFKKFDGYWQKGKPYLDTVEFKGIADTTVRNMAFEKGDGNFVEPLLPNDRNNLESKGFITGEGTMGFIMLLIPDGNNPKSPFADQRVREAVEYSMDKEGLYKGLFKGRWPPAYQQALRNDPYFNTGLPERKYDPAKAKQLLADAGYATGLKIVFHGDTRGDNDQMVSFQTYMQEVGIDSTLDIADPGRYNTMATQGWEGLLKPGFPNPSSSVSLLSRFGTRSYFPSMYSSPGWFEKWDAMRAQMDNKVRIDMIKQLIKQMVDECKIIPMYETHPQWATMSGKGQVHDLDWCGKKNTNYWNPTGAWIQK